MRTRTSPARGGSSSRSSTFSGVRGANSTEAFMAPPGGADYRIGEPPRDRPLVRVAADGAAHHRRRADLVRPLVLGVRAAQPFSGTAGPGRADPVRPSRWSGAVATS